MTTTKYQLSYYSALKLSMVFLCVSFLANSQVGIGIETPASGTILHVEDVANGGGLGVLFPKVSLIDINYTTPLPAEIESGTMVYNTNENLQRGYYYWTKTKWQRLNFTTSSMAKYSNSSMESGNNLNVSAGTNAGLFNSNPSIYLFNDEPNLYESFNGDGLRVKRSGRYQVTVNLSLLAPDSKAEIEARLTINNVEVGPYYRSSEMDPSIGSPKGSISFTQAVDLSADDELRVFCKQALTGFNGDVYFVAAGASSFFIEKLF